MCVCVWGGGGGFGVGAVNVKIWHVDLNYPIITLPNVIIIGAS